MSVIDLNKAKIINEDVLDDSVSSMKADEFVQALANSEKEWSKYEMLIGTVRSYTVIMRELEKNGICYGHYTKKCMWILKHLNCMNEITTSYKVDLAS